MMNALGKFCLVGLGLAALSAPAEKLEHPLPMIAPDTYLQLVARQPDGKWLIQYGAYQAEGELIRYRYHVRRLLADFTLDAAFHPIDYASDFKTSATPVAFLFKADGFLMVSAMTRYASDTAYTLLQAFHADGTPDKNFGEDGSAEIDVGLTGREYPRAAALTPDGKILLGGLEMNSPNSAHGFLARIGEYGVLDTDYGDNGKVNVSPEQMLRRFPSFVLRSDGTAAVAYADGETNSIAVVALAASGHPQPGFGTNGTLQSGITARELSIKLLPTAEQGLAVLTHDYRTTELGWFDRFGHRSSATPAGLLLETRYPPGLPVGARDPGRELVMAGSPLAYQSPGHETAFEYWELNENGLRHQEVEHSDKILGAPLAVFTVAEKRYVFLASDAPGVVEMPDPFVSR